MSSMSFLVAERSLDRRHDRRCCITPARVSITPASCVGETMDSGQLGVGGDGNARFAAVDLGEPASAVAAGAYHSCALLASGAVRCWGWNDSGQLGGGDLPAGASTREARSRQRSTCRPAKAIAAGGFHSCAVLETGAVACWGQNDAGQAGVMRRPDRRTVVAPGKLVDLGRGRTGAPIAAGASHTCALLDDFSVKCWGYNAHGELGVGDSLQSRRRRDPWATACRPRCAGAANQSVCSRWASNHACAIQVCRRPVLGPERLRSPRRGRQPGSGRRSVTPDRSGPSRDLRALARPTNKSSRARATDRPGWCLPGMDGRNEARAFRWIAATASLWSLSCAPSHTQEGLDQPDRCAVERSGGSSCSRPVSPRPPPRNGGRRSVTRAPSRKSVLVAVGAKNGFQPRQPTAGNRRGSIPARIRRVPRAVRRKCLKWTVGTRCTVTAQSTSAVCPAVGSPSRTDAVSVRALCPD